jgi:hypothetical protein
VRAPGLHEFAYAFESGVPRKFSGLPPHSRTQARRGYILRLIGGKCGFGRVLSDGLGSKDFNKMHVDFNFIQLYKMKSDLNFIK